MIQRKILKTLIALSFVVCFVSAMQSPSQAHTQIYTITCQGCCDNGADTKEVKTYVDGKLVSDCYTDCNGFCTCGTMHAGLGGGIDTVTTNFGMLPFASSTYYSTEDSTWNISTGNDTINTSGDSTGTIWSITGYAGSTLAYTLNCDAAGNVTLTTPPAGKILGQGYSNVAMPTIAGLSIQELQGGFQLAITLSAPSMTTIQMYDVMGRNVYTYPGNLNLRAGENEVSLSNLDGVLAGSYFLRVSTGTDTKTQSVAIKH